MNKKVKTNIEGFILALTKEEYAKADKFLENVVTQKVNQIYSAEYEKIKKHYKKDK